MNDEDITSAFILHRSSLIMPTDIGRDHLLPERPVVRPAIPPAHGMPDILAPEGVGQLLVCPCGAVVTPDRHDDIKTSDLLRQLPFLQAAHNIERIVVVDLLVVIAVEEAVD